MTSLLLLGVAGAGYLAATIGFQKSLYSDGEPGPDSRRGRTFLWTAFAVHTAAMIVWGFELGRMPGRNAPETLALTGWIMMGLYLILATAWRVEILGAFASPLATFLIIAALATAPWGEPPARMAGASSLLISFHVASILLGFAAFTLATIVALLYLFQIFLLKNKKLTGILQKMPSLEFLDMATYRLIVLGFPAMVVGMALGFARAEATHKAFLSPDVFLALVTVLIYAMYIHARLVGGWHGRKVNGLLLVGFVFLVATAVGIGTGIFPSGVHPH